MSQYDYRYDAAGRRTSVESSGSALGPTKFTSWGYDERNQVAASNRYTGSFTANPNAAIEVAPERRAYTFDPIGNRLTALGKPLKRSMGACRALRPHVHVHANHDDKARERCSRVARRMDL